jgi:hypothetical protein
VWPECVVVLKYNDWQSPPVMVDRIRIHNGSSLQGPTYWWLFDDLGLSNWCVRNSDDGAHAVALAGRGRELYRAYSVWQYGETALYEFKDGYAVFGQSSKLSFYVPEAMGDHSFWW